MPLFQSREWTRRDFFRAAGVGASAAFLAPFVPEASAQVSQSGIKRLLLFTHPDGTIINRWRSNGSGTPFPGMPAAGATVSSAPTPALVGPVLSPLERHRAITTFVDGLDNKSGELPQPGTLTGYSPNGHNGVNCLWSGARLTPAPASQFEAPRYSNAASIDQLLAARSTTRFASIVATTTDYAKQTYAPTLGMFSFAGPSQPVIGIDDPQVLFDTVFGGGLNSGATAAAKRRAARLSILDSIRGELSRVRRELPSVDRDRLDVHLQAVDDIDRRIAAQTVQTCAVPARPSSPGSPQDPVTRLQLHTSIIACAFACDLTRVASLMVGNEGSTPSWCCGDVHTTSHLTYLASSETERLAAVDLMCQLQAGVAEQFAKVLDSLDAASLLNDTLVAWGTGMGWGGPHVNYCIPFVLASRHPSFKAGWYHRFGNCNLDIDNAVPANPYQWPSVVTPHNRLLTSIMHLMGRTDVQAVGDVGVNGETGGADLDNTPISELMS
jgi:hypothetical protein